ncbi:MAG: hypothetical protein PHF76_11225 [Bacteroidales bacterium]|nr:hypothetical protein [Bacteroidales bacterium]
MKTYIFITIVVLLKFILNLYYYLLTNYYFDNYMDFLKNKNTQAFKDKQQVLALFEKAGISDSYIPYSMPAGYGQIANSTVSILENYPSNLDIFAHKTIVYFNIAIGKFQSGMKDSFNPLYWLDLIIYLPKNIISQLGLKSAKIITKILQLIYWLLGIIFSLLFYAYNYEILQFIRNIFEIKK